MATKTFLIKETLMNSSSWLYALIRSRTGVRPIGQGELAFNVDDYGAKPSGSESDKVTNTNAFVAAEAAAYAARGYVTMGGHTKQVLASPTLGYCLNAEFKHRVDVRFFGNPLCNRVFLASTTNKTANVFTNWQNVRSKYANGVSGTLRTYDSNVTVEGVWADGNQANRAASGGGSGADIGDQSTSGCCFGYAGVLRWKLRNYIATNGWLHNVDFAGATYVPTVAGNNEILPDLPSTDCEISQGFHGKVRVDDAFTIHGGIRISFHHLASIWDSTTSQRATEAGSPGYTQNGFETDEQCRDCKGDTLYAEGWSVGFQAKGHPYTAPARRTSWSNCHGKRNGDNFVLEYIPQSEVATRAAAAGSSYTPTEWLAKGMRILSCVSEEPEACWSRLNPPSGYPVRAEQHGLKVSGYNGYLVSGFTLLNGAHNHIRVYGEAKNGWLEHIVSDGNYTVQPGGNTQDAMIEFGTTAGYHRLVDVVTEKGIAGPVFEYQNTTNSPDFHVEDVRGLRASGYANANWVGRLRPNGGQATAARIVDMGGSNPYGHALRVDVTPSTSVFEYMEESDGRLAGYYSGGQKFQQWFGLVADANWTRLTLGALAAGTMNSATVASVKAAPEQPRVLLKQGEVTLTGTFTTVATSLAGTQTFGQVPAGCNPSATFPITLRTSATPSVSYKAWVASNGQIRAVALPSSTEFDITGATWPAAS